ncbi:MAG: methionine--tRNA ligase subunit beta [Promethearchaeota archaeon]
MLNLCIQAVRTLAIILAPLTPSTSEKIWTQLNLQGKVTVQIWNSASDLTILHGHKINKPTPVFFKINSEELQEKLNELRGLKMKKKAEEVKETKRSVKTKEDYVTMEDIKKLGLKLAKIISAEPVPKTSRLTKMEIDVGEEKPREIVAGIAEQYKPDQLIGKTIIVVTNMKPAKIRGIKSNGMLLAALEGKTIALLTTDTELSPGTSVS